MNPTPKKVFVNDNAMFKFSMALIRHWQSRGHEVFFEPGANPSRSMWADIIFIDFMDGNFYTYYNGEGGDRSHCEPRYVGVWQSHRWDTLKIA